MRAVFHEYGAVIFAAAIGAALMALFFGAAINGRTGLDQAAGGVMEQQTRDSLTDGSATSAYTSYGTAVVESVIFDSLNPIYSGRRIRLEEHFSALASDGSILAIQVLGICDSEGKQIDVTEEDGSSCVTFSSPGIFRVYLRAKSDTVREREAVVEFPVEREN